MTHLPTFKQKILPGLLALAIFLLLGLAAWWSWARWLARPAQTGNPAFGLCFISPPDALANDARYAGAIEAGAGWDRWPLYWHWVDAGGYEGQHQGGQHQYDTLVDQEIRRGLTPLVILMGTPDRFAQPAAAPPTSPDSPAVPLTAHVVAENMTISPPQNLFEPIFADGSDDPAPGKAINPANPWATFVFNTVERYRPNGLLARQRWWPVEAGVRHWEIWNEPDYRLFWAGSPADYYRLLEVAYKAIKTSDPAATVVLGGLAFYDQPAWFNELLRLTGGNPAQAYFDAFSFHHYLSVYQSERQLIRVKETLAAYGLAHIPIWITESGVSVWDDYPATAYQVAATEPLRGAAAEQAAYIIQHAALAFYHGVERYFHFMLHDDCGDGLSSAYGLRQNQPDAVCNPATGQPRPAFAAYQLAGQQFRELVPLWRRQENGADIVAFFRPADQARLLAVWATDGITATVALTATGPSAQLYQISPTSALSATRTLTPTGGLFNLTLSPATNQNSLLPNDDSFQIGGPPLLLIEPDVVPPTAQLTALPLTSPERILLRWQGDDPGSGIAGYQVWAQPNDQPLRLWLTHTTHLSATFNGQVGQRYGFAVSAIDRAGNVSPTPATATESTRVVAGAPVSGLALGPTGQPVVSATVTISGAHTAETLLTDAAGRWGPVSLLPGDYRLAAAAPGLGQWPAPYRLSLTTTATVVSLTLPPETNALNAGDFEGGSVWTVWQWGGQVNQPPGFDGQAGVRLGDGRGEPAACPSGSSNGQRWWVRQAVSLPADAPWLSFLYKINAPQPASDSWLTARLIAAGKVYPLPDLGRMTAAADWTLATADLSAWAGQPVEIELEVVRCTPTPFRVTVDRVSVGSAPKNR